MGLLLFVTYYLDSVLFRLLLGSFVTYWILGWRSLSVIKITFLFNFL